jgi:Reverse transcriptase (RNA-dependent DNA polymerase)
MNEEFDEMRKKEVWEIIRKENLPINRRTIEGKWILRSNKVQIPGIYFNESFTSIINDVRFQIMLVAKQIWNLKACIVDVETAFLHGDQQKEIYMNATEGINHDSNTFLLLTKTVYGKVQENDVRN